MTEQKRLKVQVSYLDKRGDERFSYLEFDPRTAEFFFTTEKISREGETSITTVPLHEANGERGYHKSIEWIQKGLFSTAVAPL